MFNGLMEGILHELNYNGLMRKQASIGRLFPTFGQRVRKVASRGGVTLVEKLPHTWHFKVASVTTADKTGNPGLQFDVYIRFVNLDEVIKKYAGEKKYWNKEKTNVDYRLLSSELMNRVDIETDCSCPADLYWGAEYIKTQRKAQYDHGEFRAPDVRNPKQYGALCKHAELVFEVLPMYVATFASFLKDFWSDEVADAVKTVGKGFTNAQRAAAIALSRKEEETMKQRSRPGEGGRSRKLSPAEEQEEADFISGETPEAEPIGDGEDVPTAQPLGDIDLGGEPEKKHTKTGSPSTSTSGKSGLKGTQTSTKSATKGVGSGNRSALRTNSKRGTK